MLRFRFSSLVFFVALLVGGPISTAPAQSVESVVENMRTVQDQQFQAVDTYIVETNLYTSYNKKIEKGGEPAYKTRTKMKGDASSNLGEVGTPAKAYGLHLDRIKKNATYEGTQTVNGVQSHILRVEDGAGMTTENSKNMQGITYYIDANRHLPVRMVMETAGKGQGPGSKDQVVTIDMTNYKTTDGLTLPHHMEIQFDLDMSKQEKQQMKQAMEKMKNMPPQQRKQMEKMMGGQQMEMMKQMMSGDPVVIDVQDVQVNVDLPEGTF